MRNTALGSLILMALISVSLAAPEGAQAQQRQVAPVGDAELTSYAKAYVEIVNLHNDLQAQLARHANKTPEAQAEIRERMRDRRLEVIEANQMSEEDYTRITFIVSTDETRREAFRKIVSQLNADD